MCSVPDTLLPLNGVSWPWPFRLEPACLDLDKTTSGSNHVFTRSGLVQPTCRHPRGLLARAHGQRGLQLRLPVGPGAGQTQGQDGSNARAAWLPGGTQPHETYRAAAGTTSFPLRHRMEMLDSYLRGRGSRTYFTLARPWLWTQTEGRSVSGHETEQLSLMKAARSQQHPAVTCSSPPCPALLLSSGAPGRLWGGGRGRVHTTRGLCSPVPSKICCRCGLTPGPGLI